MSKVAKKWSLTEPRDGIDYALSSEISRGLHMDDFLWIEKELSEANACEKHLERNSEIVTESVNIAQYGTNSESSGIIEEILPEYDAEDTENLADWFKEVLVDQQYWEHHAAVTKRESSSRKKYPASQRLTIRQLDNIANFNKIVRNPSYFKLDRATTATLETLIAKKYVGPLHNVVSEGKKTVIIHADCPDTSVVVSIWFSGGNAVKVYKLTNNVKENIVIHKRAQKEYEHLLLLRYCQNIPYVVHKMKNVLILRFIGNNQETAQSITQLPSEYFNEVYQIIVKDMDMWYTKCNIVHGNLCTKNLLFVHVKQDSMFKYPFLLYTIGWGHSVKRDNPWALMKLIKDCYFITNFFGRRGVTVRSTEELFKHITGLEKISAKVLDVIHKKDLWQDGHLTNPNR